MNNDGNNKSHGDCNNKTDNSNIAIGVINSNIDSSTAQFSEVGSMLQHTSGRQGVNRTDGSD